jgi:enediyne biosynthesis protein E4
MMRKISLLLTLYSAFLLMHCSRKEETLFKLKSPEETGITFANSITTSDSFNILTYEYIYNGAGVGIADFNNDGLQDIFFSGNQVQNRLYLNKGKLTFEDVTERTNVNVLGRWSSGVSVVDINNDGRMDVFVCATAKPDAKDRRDMLFINTGQDEDGVPQFEEQAAKYGIDFDGHSIMGAFFDYDLDGDLDLYTLVNQKMPNVPSNYRAKITDGSAANNDRLFKNNGDGTFTDATIDAGIVYEGFGLGLAISDVNLDGYPDIYVSNDYQSNDILYVNQKNGSFKNETAAYIAHQSQFSMGNDAADINNDGMPDIITLDMLPETNARKKTTIGNKSYLTYINNDKFGYEYQYTRNMLHINNGVDMGFKFSEVGMLAGVYQTEWSWSPLFADFDNDGFKDLIITNGFPKDVTDKDFANYRADVGNIATPDLLVDSIPVIKIRNYAFRNNGNLSFTDITNTWGVGIESFSYGAAFADLDNDGDLDYVVNNIDDPAFLFENRLYVNGNPPEKQSSSFLRVKLKGDKQNVNAIGAKISVFYDSGKMQFIENSIYRGFLSSVEGISHFGFKGVTKIDSLVIIFPDGSVQKLMNPALNTVHSVSYAEARKASPPKPSPGFFSQAAGSLGLRMKHEQEDVIDFNFQRTLPHKFSQSGPGIAVGDLNNDNLDDFLIGGAAGKPIQAFIQKNNGTFTNTRFAKSASNKEEDEGLLLFDANNDGYKDLYVVSGGFEHPAESNVYRDRFYLNNRKGGFILKEKALPEIAVSGSCVRASDFDGDGDLDLFIGGRVHPHNYPLPVSSFILRNDNATFTDVTPELCGELQNIGMITDALWSDYDNDGKIDLILAGELLPIMVFHHEGNKFVRIEKNFFERYKGFWSSINGHDFDKDGDTDYVMGNLGMNNPFQVTENTPLRIITKDIDGNGSVDPVIACYMRESMNSDEKKLYPVHFWDEINSQSPKFRRKFTRYKQYSKVTVEKLFTEEEIKDALILDANYLSSVYMENIGNGKFNIVALPVEAQFAPITGVLPADVNQDGQADLVLTGNDFGNEVFYGRYDAFNGLVLLGDGHGQFTHMSTRESGFYVPGDAKSLVKLFVANTAVYLAAQNKDSLKIFSIASESNGHHFLPTETDSYAVVTYKDLRKEKLEFYFGAGYLSQSTRRIFLDDKVIDLTVYDSKGEARKIDLTTTAYGKAISFCPKPQD